jgi:2-amino-4-hydroxy-6-hydroxymethyldihydropteridine diphosphokinase
MFVNAVCLVETSLSPIEALAEAAGIERDLGRIRKSSRGIYQDRIIDIDLLLYDDLILCTTELVIPHPHLAERVFVLSPLAEIAPNEVHPVLGKTFSELDAELRESLGL